METYNQYKELTPLQQAAIERTRFFQAALADMGVTVRLAYEQEFFLEHEGRPAHNVIRLDDGGQHTGSNKNSNYKDAVTILQSHGCQTLYELENEYATDIQAMRIYEAKFDNMTPQNASLKSTPLGVARDLDHFRNEALDQLLQTTSSLYSPWHGKLLTPVMKSVPYPDDPVLGTETLGLHANISMFDRKGNNLFNEPAIERACAQSLLELQYKAGLGFLQTPDSAKRFDRNASAPTDIFMGRDKYCHATLLEREAGKGKYLENRMIAANADPYVVTALELASVYDAFQKNPNLLSMPRMSRRQMERQKPSLPDGQDTNVVDRNWSDWVYRMDDAKELGDLLGKELYSGILREFGQQHSATR